MVRYAYTNPKNKKAGKYRVEPVVWAVPSSETADARFHSVSWAIDGNLNASYRRGHTKNFRSGYAGWVRAKAFARTQAQKMGIKADIHPY